MRYEARNTYTSRPGICMNDECEHKGQVVECHVSNVGIPVCAECDGDDIFNDEGKPFHRGTRDFWYAI
jgi:hypothetical protein